MVKLFAGVATKMRWTVCLFHPVCPGVLPLWRDDGRGKTAPVGQGRLPPASWAVRIEPCDSSGSRWLAGYCCILSPFLPSGELLTAGESSHNYLVQRSHALNSRWSGGIAMRRPLLSIAAILLFLAPAAARAQGLLVVVDPNEQVRLPRPIVIWPRPYPMPQPAPPPMSYKIKELDVQARLVDQVAQVQVSQTFVNTGSQPMEVSFVFPLPYDGAVERMTLMIDGREYPAKLLDAKEARRMYEEIVRKNRDPALLEWLGTGLFRTSVFPVPAGASRTVSLRYSQLCRKQEGLTDFLFPLSTAKYTSEAVEKVSIRATIESQEEIKNVYSPSHAIEIKRPDEHHATDRVDDARTKCPAAISACFTTWARES